MMELACAVLLLSASLVTATPYGYGVKGGASAKAESSATAGAFGGVGDIPVAVPLGASYSGSFSKSSSSSSSSSSASSSSSSSSFSYSGSGAGGLGLNGGAHGNAGCSSGTCPNAGDTGVSTPHGSSSGASGFGLNDGAHGTGGCSSGNCPNAGDNGVSTPHGSSSGAGGFGLNDGAHGNGGCSSGNCPSAGSGLSTPHGSSLGYNAANAAATGTLSGPGCQGLNCNSNPEKCSSGQCKPKSPTGSTTTASDTPKCASGHCGSALEGGESTGDYGSNDIRVVTDSVHNAKDQSSSFDKTSTAYNGANSDCSHGNCNSAGPLNSKPEYYGSGNSKQGSSALNQQQSSNADAGATFHYQIPSTHLETPKQSAKCSSGNCHAEHVGTSGPHETSPSSYNVPIHGSYSNGEQKPICDGVKCDNQPKRPYSSPNTNTLTTNYQQHSPSADNYVTQGPTFNSPSSNCGGSNCFANQNTGAPSSAPTSGPLNFGQQPLFNIPGHIGHTKPSDVNKPSNDKLPAYTGGFGGPAGVLNPNEFDVAAPVPTGNPSHAGITSQNGKPSGSYPTGCNSPSCSGYPTNSGAYTPTGSYGQKPSASAPSEKLPAYTGGFGGPAGMLKPNEYDIHATVSDKPSYAHPASSSYNTQSPSNNNCKTGNCGAYSPHADSTSGPISSGYSDSTKPATGINSSEKLPTYTGGFGGPEGVFNPTKYDTHQAGPTSPGHTPSGTYINPITGGCTTPNCYPSLGSSASANANAEPIGISKPSSGAHPSTLPSYTGGYHSPAGANKPNGISAIASGPSYGPSQSQSTPGSYPTGCKSGNCADFPVSGSSAEGNTQTGSFGVTKPTYVNPQYTGGFSGPSGTLNPSQHVIPTTGSASVSCKTPNCVSSPTATGGATSGINTQYGSNSQTGSFGITKPSGPTYTGGFGGAPGVLNPNEYTIPAVGATPNKPTSVPKPAVCTSGNCKPQVPQGSSSHSHNDASNAVHATAAADANAVAYTGGFGGPPGVLEPYDDGKGGVKPAHGGQAHGSQAGGHGSHNANIHSAHGTVPGANSGTTGSAGIPGTHGSGAHAGNAASSAAYAGAVAGASAGSHGYNTHGSHYNQAGNTKGGSPCGGGCGGTTGGAYNGGSNGGAYNAGSGFDFSGGLSSTKLGYSDGLSGGGSSSAASSKSLASANAFGLGGSFASSSASAHASAGAYTKGGYGKR